MNKNLWYLILNNAHSMRVFPSEKKLRAYAKEHEFKIKRSYLDYYCFYTESYQYVPGNR